MSETERLVSFELLGQEYKFYTASSEEETEIDSCFGSRTCRNQFTANYRNIAGRKDCNTGLSEYCLPLCEAYA